MPSPPSAATNDITEKLKAGVPAKELAKQYAPSMVYRLLHKLKDGDRGSALPNPPPPPGAPALGPRDDTQQSKEQAPPAPPAQAPPRAEKPAEEPPSAKGKVVRTPPPKGKYKIVTPGGGSIPFTDSITPLAQAVFMEPRVLKMSMPVYLETAYRISTTEWGWPSDMRAEDLIDTIFYMFFKDYGWILGPGAFHVTDLKELQGLRYLATDSGELTPVAE
jgi:hypothetical protein